MSPQVRARLEHIVAEGRAELAAPGPRLGLPETGTDPEPMPDPVGDETIRPVAERAVAARFERRHLLVIATVLLVGLLITGGWLIRAREVASVPIETVVPETPPTPQAHPTPTPEPVRIRVHVLGAVTTPGVVTLTEGARVADAIDAAGGLAEDARPGELNFAAPVPDGAQIVVGDRDRPRGEVRPAGPATAPDGGPAEPGGTGGPVNLNTAGVEQLEALPGVGPVTAGNIIAWRTENGPFTHVDQLQEVSGIGPKTYEKLAPLVTV